MSDIQAKITPQGNTIRSKVGVQQNFQVTEYKVNTSNFRLGDLFDVDASSVSDGAILVYNGNTVSFETTTEIKNPNTQVNGGHY
jgi:hypothetical protein